MSFVCTVDVEDWAQSTLDTNLPITERAGLQVEHLLDLLAEEHVQVTDFSTVKGPCSLDSPIIRSLKWNISSYRFFLPVRFIS